ncbi:unnamed protein product [marine sediment metagenome]|uniref:Uncharacterized protein n=1 Tax=marine sediment metagenome TaxID=412755 RepID=X0SG55_9ZZZZ
MKIELEENVWVTGKSGEKRCTKKENAEEFDNMKDALAALAKAREFKPFKNAIIQEDMF